MREGAPVGPTPPTKPSTPGAPSTPSTPNQPSNGAPQTQTSNPTNGQPANTGNSVNPNAPKAKPFRSRLYSEPGDSEVNGLDDVQGNDRDTLTRAANLAVSTGQSQFEVDGQKFSAEKDKRAPQGKINVGYIGEGKRK